jgi:hypothetical protein
VKKEKSLKSSKVLCSQSFLPILTLALYLVAVRKDEKLRQ